MNLLKLMNISNHRNIVFNEENMIVITTALVKQLRTDTNAPMMECKKALIEADGDLVQAKEMLYAKLDSKILKISSRMVTEGVVAIYIVDDVYALVEINCETDFVAHNKEFIHLANQVVKLIAEKNPQNLTELAILQLEDNLTVEAKRMKLIGCIRENILIRRFKRVQTPYKLASYLHGTRIGVVVEFEGVDERIGKDIAMHIAAMQPVALFQNQVPISLIEKERSRALLRAKKSEKTPDIIKKIVNGSVQKYLKEVSLYNQLYVKDHKQSVEQILKITNTIIKSFNLFVVGQEI